ncbi:hypothetical protein D3C85_57580 [compost metagenome]
MLVLHAIESVHAHHQRLWWTLLGDHRPGVFPQRQNARLRKVITDLVVDRVELDVGGFVDPWAVGGEARGADEGHAVDALTAGELTAASAAGQAFLPVIHARFVVRRTRHRQGTVGAERLGDHLIAGQQGIAWMVFFRVESHRGLFDFGAFFRQVNRFGAGDFLGEIQRSSHGVGFATRRDAVKCMPLQTAIPTTGLRRVEVGPQRFAAGFERLRGGGVEHVQWRSWWPLADRAFHAADPEWIARVFQAAVGIAVGFAAIDQRQRANGLTAGVAAMVLAVVIALFFVIVVIIAGNQGFTDFRHHHDFARHRCHGFAGQRHDGRNRRTGDYFTIGQGPCTRRRFAAAQGKRFAVIAIGALLRNIESSALFEDIVHPPHGPHALSEVWIEMAVIDRIAGHAVAVARTTVGDFIGVTGAWANALRVDVVGVVVVGVEQPLMAVQVEDVLLMAIVGIAEFDEVTDVAVVDVRRLRRIQGHGGFHADLIGARYLAGGDVLKPGVGRHIHQHRHIADGVRAEKEFFIGARQAIVHRPHAQAVGDHFGAHAAGAIVDHERVAGRLQHMGHHRVGPIRRERLGGGGFILELRGKIAERFEAVGDCRVAFSHRLQRVGAGRKTAVGVAAHDNRVAFAGDDFTAVDHVDDRRSGLAFAQPRFALRVARLVVDDRLTGGCAARSGQAHFFFGEGIAIAAATLGQDDDLAEQAIGDVAGRALAAKRCATAAHGKRAFTFGEQGIGTARARWHQRVGVTPGERRNVIDAVHRLQAVDLEADVTIRHLLIDFEVFGAVGVFRALFFALVLKVLVRVGLIVEQVLQIDRQAIAGSHAQHQRPWTLVRAQRDFAWHCGAAVSQ